MTERDELAVVVGQPPDGLVQRQAQPAPREILQRIGPDVLRLHLPGLPVLVDRQHERQRPDFPAPEMIDGGISGDPEQPRGKLRLSSNRAML